MGYMELCVGLKVVWSLQMGFQRWGAMLSPTLAPWPTGVNARELKGRQAILPVLFSVPPTVIPSRRHVSFLHGFTAYSVAGGFDLPGKSVP